VCYFNSTEVLPSLKTLKVRELARASPKISLIDGINQMHALRELDLSGNDLSKDDIHDNLQVCYEYHYMICIYLMISFGDC
jgi:hypothetical protein